MEVIRVKIRGSSWRSKGAPWIGGGSGFWTKKTPTPVSASNTRRGTFSEISTESSSPTRAHPG
jgi:hypothetical protein